MGGSSLLATLPMDRQLNLLMFSGDRDIARGREGPFFGTLAGLSEHFDRIDVLTPQSPGSGAGRIHGNVYLHPAGGGRAAQPRYITNQVARLAAVRRYALAISHDYGLFYNGLGASRVKASFGIPYVSEIHHVPGHPRPANNAERLLKLLTRWYVQWVSAEVLAFRVVNGMEMPRLLMSWGVPAQRLVLLHSAYLDFEVFGPRPAVAKIWDVVFCGRLVANKGLDLLAEAAAIIATIRSGTRFLVIGEGPERGTLERKLNQAGIKANFTFHGWLDSPEQLAAAYRSARLLVCTSYNEGGPRVCLEAMACGLPVVSTSVGLMPELIEDGLSGRLVDWDAQEIAAAVLEVLADPAVAARMGRLARDAVKPFARDRTLERYGRTYREMAQANLVRLGP